MFAITHTPADSACVVYVCERCFSSPTDGDALGSKSCLTSFSLPFCILSHAHSRSCRRGPVRKLDSRSHTLTHTQALCLFVQLMFWLLFQTRTCRLLTPSLSLTLLCLPPNRFRCACTPSPDSQHLSSLLCALREKFLTVSSRGEKKKRRIGEEEEGEVRTEGLRCNVLIR